MTFSFIDCHSVQWATPVRARLSFLTLGMNLHRRSKAITDTYVDTKGPLREERPDSEDSEKSMLVRISQIGV